MYSISLLSALGVLQRVGGDTEHTPLMVKTLPKHVNTPIAFSHTKKPTRENKSQYITSNHRMSKHETYLKFILIYFLNLKQNVTLLHHHYSPEPEHIQSHYAQQT